MAQTRNILKIIHAIENVLRVVVLTKTKTACSISVLVTFVTSIPRRQTPGIVKASTTTMKMKRPLIDRSPLTSYLVKHLRLKELFRVGARLVSY